MSPKRYLIAALAAISALFVLWFARDTHMLAGMLRVRFPDAFVDACAPGEDEVPTCVADHLRRSVQRGQGLLLISRTDYVPSSWWDQAQARIAPRALQSIRLPFHMVRAGMPPARYEYRWQPAQAPR